MQTRSIWLLSFLPKTRQLQHCCFMTVWPEHGQLDRNHRAPRTASACVQLSDSEFLKNDLIDAVHFLENLSLREPLEKTRFFRNLPKLIPTLPAVVCTRKLLPLVAAALEYGGAPATALACLLQARRLCASTCHYFVSDIDYADLVVSRVTSCLDVGFQHRMMRGPLGCLPVSEHDCAAGT